jgi:hypothetical protein
MLPLLVMPPYVTTPAMLILILNRKTRPPEELMKRNRIKWLSKLLEEIVER